MRICFVYRYELVDTMVITSKKGEMMLDIIKDNMDDMYYLRQLSGIDLRHNDYTVLTSSYNLEFCRGFIKTL